MATPEQPNRVEESNRDLGFGSVVARQTRWRLINRDGSFNVVRKGLGWRASLHLYNSLLVLSWPRLIALVAFLFVATNSLFALGYLGFGPGALQGSFASGIPRFFDAYFFSVQTLSTIGYGGTIPIGLGPNLLVSIEALVGLLGFALVTGVVFARFSRPSVKIAFSKIAIIAPYRDITAFEFRIANLRSNQILELEAQVIFSRLESAGGRTVRRFTRLDLERDKVSFFPLAWTIVHPIDTGSPLYGLDAESCSLGDAEFLILLTGIDETFSQTVHTRSSYKADEIVWGVRFKSLIELPTESEPLSIDIGNLDEVEKIDSHV